MEVLFVCTGNICRSPIAERLAAAAAARLQLADFSATSAGTRAVVGHEIHPHAREVLEQLGGSGAGFRARQLTAKVANCADLILTMTTEHRDAVLELTPRLLHRTFTLAEAAALTSGRPTRTVADLAANRGRLAPHHLLDVRDPISEDRDFFGRVGAQIAELMAPVLEFCQRAAESDSGNPPPP